MGARANRGADTRDRIAEALRPLAVPIGKLTEDEKNVRTHSERNLATIAASLERFGQQAPAVFVRRGRKKIVIKGNGLLAAARSLGWTHLAAVESGLSGHEATAFAIVDNRSTDLSSFDTELLTAQLQELEEAEFDLPVTGFETDELQQMLDDIEGAGTADETAPPSAAGERKRGQRTTEIVIGPLRFEVPRAAFTTWLGGVETKAGDDRDRTIREIKRRLKLNV